MLAIKVEDGIGGYLLLRVQPSLDLLHRLSILHSLLIELPSWQPERDLDVLVDVGFVVVGLDGRQHRGEGGEG